MTTPWLKAFRDLWRERARALLVACAVAIGIAGFSTVLSSWAVLTRERDRNYLGTNPASATVVTDRVDDEVLGAVLADPRIAAAEARRRVTGRLMVGPLEWRTLVLFVIPDFAGLRVSTVVPQEGGWPPGPGELVIERDALGVARAAIGGSVTVKTHLGPERSLRVAGTVHDPGQAQARMENVVYGYVVPETLKLLGETTDLNQLKLLVASNRLDEAHVRAVAGDVRRRLEELGHPVLRVDVPEPGQHPHARIMGLLLLVMAAFGLFVLLLTGVLVVNLVGARMASEVRPIGAMKALGATRGRIVRLYLPQALLLGSAALLVAAPVGLWGSRALTSFLAVFLNFDIASFAAPAWVHALAGAVGLGVPFLAAVPSVWKGTRVPVREALADFGATRDAFGTGVLDRWLARAGGRSRPVLLAVRNVFRRRARLGLTLATLTTAGLFFLSALNVRASLVHTLDRFFALHPYDLQVGLRGMAPHASIDRAAARTEGIVRVEKWIATEGAVPSAGGTAAPEASRPSGAHGGGGHGGGGHGGGAGGDRFPVLALPAGTGLLAFDLVEGRGLESGETDAMVVNEALAARRPQFRAGSTVPVQMGPAVVAWRVVGVTREPFAPPVAYVPLAFFEARGHVDQANALRVKLAGTDAGSVNRVKDALERHLGAEGVRVTSNLSRAERRLGFDQHMLMIYVFLFVVAGILGVIGGLGLMTTLSLNVLERRRELGVLRAIGATPGTIGRIVIAEGAFTALLGALLASLLSWPASRALGDLAVQVMFRSRVDFALDPLGPPAWSLLSLLLGGLASFLPAWHASRRSVREAISWE